MKRVLGRCEDGSEPIELWHSEFPSRQARAAQICRNCILVEACRSWALTSLVLEPGVVVVCGGMTETEIREERRRLHLKHPRAINPVPPKRRILAATINVNSQSKVGIGGLSTAHGNGHHDIRPRAGCPRCETKDASS